MPSQIWSVLKTSQAWIQYGPMMETRTEVDWTTHQELTICYLRMLACSRISLTGWDIPIPDMAMVGMRL